uniref:Uncharacterized protein n=1 Tax=Aegilops tauschii subsp. strangulata TaxID=200361 RepID=A0A453N6W4_AEGTS
MTLWHCVNLIIMPFQSLLSNCFALTIFIARTELLERENIRELLIIFFSWILFGNGPLRSP